MRLFLLQWRWTDIIHLFIFFLILFNQWISFSLRNLIIWLNLINFLFTIIPCKINNWIVFWDLNIILFFYLIFLWSKRSFSFCRLLYYFLLLKFRLLRFWSILNIVWSRIISFNKRSRILINRATLLLSKLIRLFW